jgi:hypothetical protein
MTAVYAADVQPEPANLAYQEEMDENLAELEEIAANREAVIEELVQMWFMEIPDWEAEFRSLLNLANDSKLLAILNAKSYTEIQAILGGGTPNFYSADSMADPFSLGDHDKDFVYTPVKPCRIVDTREAGGKITSGSSRGFYVYGTGIQMSAQGGNSAGCSSPRGEPRAVHINIVAVNSVASGWLTVWPYGASKPLAGVLNYYPNRTDPVSNAFTVKTGYAMARDINVYAHKTTHVVADVMGYYYDVDEDEFKVRTAAKMCGRSPNLVTGSSCTNSNCNQLSINVPGPGKIFVDAKLVIELFSHTQGTGDYVEVFIASTPTECYSSFPDAFLAMSWGVPANTASWGDGLYFDDMEQPISLNRVFTVTGSGTKTYYLNTQRFSGTGIMRMSGSLMRAFYYPDF